MIEDNREKTASMLRQEHLEQKAARDHNEAFSVSRKKKIIEIILLAAGGALMSAAFPPLNLTWLVWVALVPLFLLTMNKSPWRAACSGFVWGYVFSLMAFFWLREIESFLPFVMAFVLGLFPACWAAAVPWLRRGLLIPAEVQLKGFEAEERFCSWPLWREMLLVLALGAWWCVVEWIRSWIATGLPWNFLSATQWRNVSLIQICEFTGVYGVSFMIAVANIAVAMAVVNFLAARNDVPVRRPYPLLLALGLIVAALVIGASLVSRYAIRDGEGITFKAAVIQGDISQRRSATIEQADEAVSKYLMLSEQAAVLKPDIIVWPETATPYPLRGSSLQDYKFYYQLRTLILKYQIPYLVGTIDFEIMPPGVKRRQGVTNSALLFDGAGNARDKFDKVHRVPFGEYIPFRRYLPEGLTRMIDMGRDLTPGTRFNPLNIYPGVYAGIGICFEDIFPYVARQEVLNGANLLAVITNDAWYPRSSEPEQHLANSIFRTIETRLPMIRCGNNSASCLIAQNGVIVDGIFKQPGANGSLVPDVTRRGEGISVFKVTVPAKPKLTFYSRFGDVFIGFCWLLFGIAGVLSVWNWRQKKTLLQAVFDKE